jgi:hypothetical protein
LQSRRRAKGCDTDGERVNTAGPEKESTKTGPTAF